MSLQNVKDRLGEHFAVAGSWLYDGDESINNRVVGGTFRLTVLARSASEAMGLVESMIGRDVIVTGLEVVR